MIYVPNFIEFAPKNFLKMTKIKYNDIKLWKDLIHHNPELED